MGDNNVKMGFEGQIFFGDAGATASTLLENVMDISYNLDTEDGDTTVRGDSSSIPIATSDVTELKVQIEWTMIDDVTDTAYSSLMDAAFAGEGVAIRTKSHSGGKGFDGDCTVKAQDGMPLNGAATTQFTATPSRSYGRDPILRT